MRKSFIKITKKEALKSKYQYKLGCILVHGSTVVSKGHNKSTKTHKIAYYNNTQHECATIHAEIDALIGVSKEDAKKCDLYVVRVRRKDHKLAMAKPCKMCQKIINKMGIKRVIYSINDNKFGIIDLRNSI